MSSNKSTKYFRGIVTYQTVFYLILSFMIGVISARHNVETYANSKYYSEIAHHISLTTNARAYLPGTTGYNKRRKVSNGLCNAMFPDLIVVPKTTMDVSKIVQISRHYKVPITVRSGGHSFLCSGTKSGM